MVLFCTSHFFMQLPLMLSMLLMLVCFLKDVLACPYIYRGKIVCPQTLSKKKPERATNSATNSTTNFWKCAKNYAIACFRSAGMFTVHLQTCLQTHLQKVPRTLLAGGVWRDLWDEIVAVYRSCFAEKTHTMEALAGTVSAVASSLKANRTRYLQVTPTKAPATKPRAHAVSHGQQQ